MNTAQSYVGGGNYATTSPQPVFSDHQSPPVPADRPFIHPHVYRAQNRLLELVDQFAARGHQSPIEAAGELLNHWLATPAEQLTAEDDKDQLQAVNLLIDALDKIYPINSLPTLTAQNQWVNLLRALDQPALRLSPSFLNRFELTDAEEERAGLLLIPDQSMAPQLEAGSTVLAVSLDRAGYSQATGVVLCRLQSAPHRLILGRVGATTNALLLVRDNPEFVEMRLHYRDISYLGQVRYILTQPVV